MRAAVVGQNAGHADDYRRDQDDEAKNDEHGVLLSKTRIASKLVSGLASQAPIAIGGEHSYPSPGSVGIAKRQQKPSRKSCRPMDMPTSRSVRPTCRTSQRTS